MFNKEKIKELSKVHNIDEDLVLDFIEETGAYPFLMGEPSSYLIAFIEDQKGIKIHEAVIKRFLFDQSDLEINLIISARDDKWKKKCHYCSNEIYDYLLFSDTKNHSEKCACFFCFSVKTFSFYIGISEKRIKNYFQKLSENNTKQQIIKIILSSIYLYYNLKLTDEKTLNLLGDQIKANSFDLKDFFDQINHLREYTDQILIFSVIREIYVNKYQRQIDAFDHKDFLYKEANKSEASILPSGPFKEISIKIDNAKPYYGRRMQPWIIENKTGRTTYGYVLEILRETQKAILCRYTLLDNTHIYEDWIPKSTLDDSSVYLHNYLLEKILERMGYSE